MLEYLSVLTGTGDRTRALTSSYNTTGADQSGLCETGVLLGSGLAVGADFEVFHRIDDTVGLKRCV